jgi:hypothetical protein
VFDGALMSRTQDDDREEIQHKHGYSSPTCIISACVIRAVFDFTASSYSLIYMEAGYTQSSRTKPDSYLCRIGLKCDSCGQVLGAASVWIRLQNGDQWLFLSIVCSSSRSCSLMSDNHVHKATNSIHNDQGD